jgi:hypothetical protein
MSNYENELEEQNRLLRKQLEMADQYRDCLVIMMEKCTKPNGQIYIYHSAIGSQWERLVGVSWEEMCDRFGKPEWKKR